ncbi:TRAP transporter substrate-binding protein [Thermodesulfobacteriota bacterium]
MRQKIGLMFIGIFLATLLTSAWLPTPAVAKPITLNYASGPPAPTFPSVQMERWKEEVEKRAGGKVSIKTYPGGSLLKDKVMMDGVISGVADIGVLAIFVSPGRFPVTLATNLPLGMPSSLVASQVLLDVYNKYKPKEFSKVKVLTMFTSGPANIMSKKPVRKLEDIKGMDLRASGVGVEVLKRWSANPVGMPMPETPEALQKGVVQGLFSSFDVMKSFKFAEICSYATLTKTLVYPMAVIMNKDSWESLPKDVQKIMDDMAKEQAIWTGKFMDGEVNKAREWSVKTHNVEFIELSKDEKARFDQLVEPMIGGWIESAGAKGFPAREIISDIKAFTEKYQ